MTRKLSGILIVLGLSGVAAQAELRREADLSFAPGTRYVAAQPPVHFSTLDLRSTAKARLALALRGEPTSIGIVPQHAGRHLSSVSLIGPDGRRVTGVSLGIQPAPQAAQQLGVPAAIYTLELAAGQPPGQYVLDLSDDTSGATTYTLLVQDSARLVMESQMSRRLYGPEDEPVIFVHLRDSSTAAPLLRFAVTAQVKGRGPEPQSVVLSDNGSGADRVAGDGVYSGRLTRMAHALDDVVVVQVEAQGTVDRLPLHRSGQARFQLASGDAQVVAFAGSPRHSQSGISIPLNLNVRRRGLYRLRASLVGNHEGNRMLIAQAQTVEQLPVARSTVTLTFSTSDIAAARIEPPWELRDVALEDVRRNRIADDLDLLGSVAGFRVADLVPGRWQENPIEAGDAMAP